MKCQQCGNNYKRISSHWAQSRCKHPEITEKQKEIITGVLMGDGYINKAGTPSFCIKNTNKAYLDFLSEQLDNLVSSVKLTSTAKESAEHSREIGLSKKAVKENYSDIYTLNGRAHPELSTFKDWYSTGEKIFPKTIELTPTVLKHWYVCDGSWHTSGYDNYISIGVSNERNNKEKIENFFENSPANSLRWNEHRRKGGGGEINCIVEFTVEDSKKLWKWMGNPPKGFEYKWPDKYIYKD